MYRRMCSWTLRCNGVILVPNLRDDIPRVPKCALSETRDGLHVGLSSWGARSGQIGGDRRKLLLGPLLVDYPSFVFAERRTQNTHTYTHTREGGEVIGQAGREEGGSDEIWEIPCKISGEEISDAEISGVVVAVAVAVGVWGESEVGRAWEPNPEICDRPRPRPIRLSFFPSRVSQQRRYHGIDQS